VYIRAGEGGREKKKMKKEEETYGSVSGRVGNK
jgi:hypothetical protein